MYKNIEKSYIKGDPNRRFDVFYWTISFVLGSIASFFLLIGNRNKWLIMILFFLAFISCIIIYIIDDAKKYFPSNYYYSGVMKWLKDYVIIINHHNIKNLIDILSKNHIATKDDLRQCILHYQKRGSNTIKGGFFLSFLMFFLIVFCFFVVIYQKSIKFIDYTKWITMLNPSIVMILVSFLLLCCFKVLISDLLYLKEPLYEEIEDHLTYIYIHSD